MSLMENEWTWLTKIVFVETEDNIVRNILSLISESWKYIISLFVCCLSLFNKHKLFTHKIINASYSVKERFSICKIALIWIHLLIKISGPVYKSTYDFVIFQTFSCQFMCWEQDIYLQAKICKLHNWPHLYILSNIIFHSNYITVIALNLPLRFCTSFSTYVSWT